MTRIVIARTIGRSLPAAGRQSIDLIEITSLVPRSQ